MMKLTVERGLLLKALSHMQSVVERRQTIPVLSNGVRQSLFCPMFCWRQKETACC